LFRAVFNGRPVSSASFGMRTDWVWAQARAGLIPHIRLGRYRRFRESAVEAWLRELEAEHRRHADRADSAAAPPSRLTASPPHDPCTSPAKCGPGTSSKKNWTPFGPRGAFVDAVLNDKNPAFAGPRQPVDRTGAKN
jgi:hypothetical protein